MLEEAQIIQILENALEQASGTDQDESQQNKEQALDYYYGRLPGPPLKANASRFVSLDVRNQIEAIKANMMPAFGTDSVVEFEANGPQDEDQAKIESDVVNQQIVENNNGYALFLQAIHDALLQRNAVIKVWVQEREVVQEETLTPESVGDGIPFSKELISLRVDQISQDPAFEAELVSFTDEQAKVKITEQQKRLRLDTIAPENFKTSPDWPSIYLEGIPYCIERFETTKGELLELGFNADLVEKLKSHEQNTESDRQARNQAGFSKVKFTQDKAQTPVLVHIFHIEIDEDEDGVAELRRVVFGSRIILEDEPANWIPYAAGTGMLQPHRFEGQSIYDVERFIQDAKSRNIRQWLDNQTNNNNRRLLVQEGKIDYEAFENSEPGGYVNCKGDPNSVTAPIPYDDLSPSCLALAGYLDRDRTERGGAALDLQAGEAQIVDVANRSTERQFSSKEQLAQMMTKTLAETLIRSVYLLTHKTIRKLLPGAIQLKRTGTWQTTNPGQWPPRNRVNVKVGLSAGERQRRAASLQMIIQAQSQALGMGQKGILVDFDQLHQAVLDWGKALELDNPEQYWIDPASPPAQQAAQKAEQGRRQQQQMQLQLQAMQAQMLQQTEQIKQQAEAQQQTEELQFKYFNAILNADIEEAREIAEVRREAIKASAGGNGAADTAGA